jgi:hypothetical protein
MTSADINAIKTNYRYSSATAAGSFLAGSSNRGVLKGSSKELWRSLHISVAPLPTIVVLWTPVVLSWRVVIADVLSSAGSLVGPLF